MSRRRTRLIMGEWAGGGIPETPPTGVTLTAYPSSGGASVGIQRDIGAATGSPRFAGTYSGGTPSGFEGRVLRVSDSTVVTDWTALTSLVFAGGAFSGKLAGVPQGAGYKREVRVANATSVTAADATPFMIGIGLACYGQSNMNSMFSSSSSPPAANANTGYFDGSNWVAVPNANGIRVLLNAVQSETAVPVFAVNGAQAGTGLDALSKGNGSGYYEAFIAKVQAMQGAEFFLWRHGESAAAGVGMAQEEYLSKLSTLHGDVASDVGRTKAQIASIVSGLASAPTTEYDELKWDNVQRTLIEAGNTLTNTIYSHSNMDVSLLPDNLHVDGPGNAKTGARYARAVTTLLGETTGYAKFAITAAATVNATTTTIDVTHGIGTDFTPTSGITGFEVSDDNGSTWEIPSAAVRTSATRITLTHSSMVTDSNRKVRYQFGKNADVSNPVLDNSSLNAPLMPSAGLISPTPITVLPAPTFLSSFALADGGANKTATGRNIGTASANRKMIIGVLGSNSNVPTSLTFTPNTGSPVVFTQTVNRPVSGPNVQFWEGDMPEGTSADITLAFSSNPFTNFYMVMWSVDKSTLLSQTPTSSGSTRNASGVNSVTQTLNISEGGFILALGYMQAFSGNSGSIAGEAPDSWTSRLNLSANGGWNLAYDTSGTAANASNDITATFGLNTANLAVAAVHYR